MKNIGILTFHFVQNYGALLQAAALQKAVEHLGHKAFFIDYRPDHVENGGDFFIPTNFYELKANAKIAHLKFGQLKRRFRHDDGQERAFQRFSAQHLTLGPRCYSTLAELQEDPPEADIYICGSDQIWNKSLQFGFDPAYFLHFGKLSVKKASYAASFGRSGFHADDLDQIAKLLTPLGLISTREASGEEVVRGTTKRESWTVPDPTFLLKEPKTLMSPCVNEGRRPFIFSYVLRAKRLAVAVEKFISSRNGLPVVTPPGSVNTSPHPTPQIPVGPGEWLRLIHESEFVITNSFHGTVFAILFQKPFITVALEGKKAAYNERASSLLSQLKLPHRMLTEYDEKKISSLIDEPVDWGQISTKIDVMRSAGKDVLGLICN